VQQAILVDVVDERALAVDLDDGQPLTVANAGEPIVPPRAPSLLLSTDPS
jgi:hypothetical protein